MNADTRMPRILQTRKAEIGRSLVLKNQHRVVARIPLMKTAELWEPPGSDSPVLIVGEFLDEIGDMPHLLQVKLMRVLQEKKIERIGGKTRQIDFRVISATNLDLEAMVRQKAFRLDLFYRLNEIIIRLPPLRDIREDILQTFNHFLNQLSLESHRKIHEISPEAASALLQYSWPGNVRELRNVVERAMIVCKGNRIELDDLPMSVTVKQAGDPPRSPVASLKIH